MEIARFKEIEVRYRELKAKLEQGQITPDALKQEMKKLMLLDEAGRYWMIGGKSGRWYVYDGTEWKLGGPGRPETDTRPLIQAPAAAPPVTPPAEQVKLKEDDPLPCKYCHSRIPVFAVYCPFCGGKQKKLFNPRESTDRDGDLLLGYIYPPSLAIFLGGVGLVCGVVFGAAFGIFKIGGDLIRIFPVMLQETRGRIQGGLIFGVLGGAAGFTGCSFLAFLYAQFFNFISSLFGGIRFRTRP